MANKRKITTAIVASTAAVALLLGGTFAWTSIQQEAKNESSGIVNVGGRLHDDFNGENKDIYVENFTDPLDGGQPIYARVRLNEYMEVGKDAGQASNSSRDATPVVSGTNINDVTTWTPHVPSTACEFCDTGDTCKIHDHWKWEMGGQTTFMPTFNKDKDSLAADINGTYHGTDNTDKVYYDDYVTYVTTGGAEVHVINGTVNGSAPASIPTGGSALTEANVDVTTVIDTAYYDNDTDTEQNDHVAGTGVTMKTETHTAKETANGSVMTMQAWIDAGKAPGNYWVYDTDGWAYWANPIMPGEATGLLLDKIHMYKNPGEKCYYAINVVAQFATAGDWEPFDTATSNAPTTEALAVLNAAVNNVATVNVTTDATSVKPGGTAAFTATATTSPVVSALAEPEFEWSVLDDELNEIVADADATPGTVTTIDTNGLLTVGTDETSTTLTVVARSKQYPGAVGKYVITVNYDITTTNETTATPYVLMTQNGTNAEGAATYTMSFVRTTDTIKATSTHNGAKIVNNYTGFETETYVEDSLSTSENRIINNPWFASYATSVTRVNIENTIKPASTAFWFTWFTNLTSVEGLANLDTSNVTTMECMFVGTKLTKIEGVSAWDVGNVTNMKDAFFTNPDLTTIDNLTNWNVSNVESLQAFAGNCPNLETIGDLSKWNVGKVKRMNSMFSGCESLETIGILDEWNVSSVTTMGRMFLNCANLEPIGTLEKWKPGSVKEFTLMFKGCEKFINLDLTNWDMSSALDLSQMFDSCTELVSVGNLDDWDVNGVGALNHIFYNCQKLEDVGTLAGWDVSSVQSMQSMFNGSAIKELDLTGWDVGKVINMESMFSACANLTKIGNITNWNTENVENMSYMFWSFKSETELNLSSWNVNKVTNYNSFSGGTSENIIPPIWVNTESSASAE